LSRAPIHQATEEDEIDEIEKNLGSINAINADLEEEFNEFNEEVSDLLIKEVQKEAEKDPDYQLLKNAVMEGDYRVLTVKLDPYGKYLDMLSIDDNGLIIKDGRRLLILESMRTRWINYLQNLHLSPEKVIERARKSIWWPFINSDLKQRRRTCETCVERSPSNLSDQMKPHEPAVNPFQPIHADLGNYGGKQWIIITDQFSGWPLMRNLGKEALSRDLIKSFMMVFANYGIPEMIVTDGGPQFKSKKEFEELCEKFMINHETSSPQHPQSNVHAENAVKQMKRLIHCTFDPQLGTVNLEKCTKALLLLQNTPRRPSGLSPAEILFGRVLRDGVPTKLNQYLPQHHEAVLRCQEAVECYRHQMQKVKNVRRSIKGDRVAVQDPVSKQWNLRVIVINEP